VITEDWLHLDRSACPGTRHGTYVAHTKYGCRCPDAREDLRLYTKRRKQGRAPVRRIDATGTIRRVKALWTIGHNSDTIAAAITNHGQYLSADSIRNIARGRRWVTPATHAAIHYAYDALSMTRGTSLLTHLRATAAGYHPPLAWDDETIDDPDAKPLGRRRGEAA